MVCSGEMSYSCIIVVILVPLEQNTKYILVILANQISYFLSCVVVILYVYIRTNLHAVRRQRVASEKKRWKFHVSPQSITT